MHSPTTKMAKCRTLLTSFFGGDLVMRFCDNWYTSACLIFLIQILLSAITAATTVQNGLQKMLEAVDQEDLSLERIEDAFVI